MITIVEPKENIDKLWGKQKIREGETYRMMRYVLRVDHEDKVLLHNVVTGRLVVLDREEAEALTNLPAAYSPVMEHLVTEHYLVPEDSDEYQQVINLQNVFRMLDESIPKKIEKYTILPTTACNARCYYCFEHGARIATMSVQTASDVVEFIKTHSDLNKPVMISWFGGEPTLASERIDQICKGLQRGGVDYRSEMTTNGYLFDENMVNRAKLVWHLQSVMICVDGTEKNYNTIKSYINPKDNPYERVLRNVGLLINQKIYVMLRMNFDLGNYLDFKDVVQEAKERFCENPYLQVCAHPINGEYKNRDGKVLHGSEAWFEKKICELNDISYAAGLFKRYMPLPSLRYRLCQAASERAVTITPEGNLVSCPEQFSDVQIKGNLKTGVTNEELVCSWKKIDRLDKCRLCYVFPDCVRISNCSAIKSNSCFYLPEMTKKYTATALRFLNRMKNDGR